MQKKEFDASAGYDLRIPKETIVPLGRSVIPLNFRIELPEGYGAFIMGRSGMVSKGIKGKNIYNNDRECRFDCDVNLGLVDCGYQGVVGVLVNNHDKPFKLCAEDPIAQMVIQKCENVTFSEVEEFASESERGKQGFNS